MHLFWDTGQRGARKGHRGTSPRAPLWGPAHADGLIDRGGGARAPNRPHGVLGWTTPNEACVCAGACGSASTAAVSPYVREVRGA